MTLTREEFAALEGGHRREGYLFLPCGPDRGCEFDACHGWAQIRDHPIDLRHWTPAEIAEARAWHRGEPTKVAELDC